jgi:glycosyltransferase involved in cell wall biosynthesis
LLELAYVGPVVPDREPFNSPPFSRSGNLWQAQLLEGMKRAGLRPGLILSFVTASTSAPGRRLWVGGGLVTDDAGNRIRLIGFPNITPLKQLWLGISAFLRLAWWSFRRLGRPRVIHAYNLSVPPGLFLWLAARLTGAGFSASLNDVDIPGQTVPDRLFFRLDYRLQRFLIPRLDARVVVADAIAQDLAPGKHFLRLEGGVGQDLVALVSRSRKDRASAGGAFRIVAVGRLNEINAFDLILAAMEQLRDVDVRLDIAGDGPLAGRVEEAARADARIRSHGFLSLERILDLYAAADLVLVIRRTGPATRYFFPGKLMEAMLSGVPVLATGTGHLEEEYGPFLYLLRDETANGLAARIREIAAIPGETRMELGAKAGAMMVSSKSWEIQARRFVDYLERHLDRRE